jgi:hypothetical protein
MTAPLNPNAELWGKYQFAFDYFNTHLFEGQLPACILNFNARGGSLGFFKKGIWAKGSEASFHQISLNPHLLKREDDVIFQTLVRLMVILWQHTYGEPSDTPDYFNRSFTEKMASIGLSCEKAYGKNLKHTVTPEGLYATVKPQALQEFFPLKNFAEWKPTPKTRIKYTCTGCGFVAMAPGGGNLVCMTEQCNAEMQKEHLRED